MPLSETKLKNKVLKFIKSEYPDAWIYKAADRFTSGIPDLLICRKGLFYAIELKVGSNKATKLQEYVLRQIHRAGGRTAVCRTVDQVRNLLVEGGDLNGQSR